MAVEFFSRGYLLDDDDGKTVAMNAFTGGEILHMMIICRCVGRHVNPTLAMVTQKAQR
jgi:hypothetical protein